MLKLFSPAKINLFLRILSKEPTGYHSLSSVFQTISLGDTLLFEAGHDEKDHLTTTDASLPTDQSNLVIKATELFRKKTGSKQGFNIHLVKQIPHEAGLGGGSGNAATTLWACNQLTNMHLSTETLQQWSAEIGSDIPFFFSKGTAYCTGRGEQVENLPPLPSTSLFIIKPQDGLSTPEVYRRLNFRENEKKEKRGELEAFLTGNPIYVNDLEQPAFEIRPELKKLKKNLQEQGFDVVLMSGSGSSFFCLGKAPPSLPSNIRCFPAHFLNRNEGEWYVG